MSIIKNFRNPWEDDNWVLQTDVLDTSVLDTDVLNTSVLSQNNDIQFLSPPSPRFFPLSRVESVRSLTWEEYLTKTIKGNEKTLDDKIKLRNKRLAETTDWDKNNLEIKTAKENLAKRWELYQIKLYGKLLDYRTIYDFTGEPVLDFDEIFKESNDLVDKDLEDIAKLSSRYSSVKAEVLNSHKAYISLRNSVKIHLEEKYQFKRFDDYYENDENLKSILSAIKGVTFSPAEIKAVNAQETGDFTITTIDGLKNKTKGIINNKTVNPTYKGLGQHGTGARDEGIKWAKEKGIIIPSDPDPRFTPQTAIYLTAAYFGYLVEKQLLKRLPKPIPSGVELKKLVFASYNWTHNKVILKVNDLGNKGKPYTWDDIKNVSPAETRIYIERITLRLTLKG